jgi:hypothetical protein
MAAFMTVNKIAPDAVYVFNAAQAARKGHFTAAAFGTSARRMAELLSAPAVSFRISRYVRSASTGF